jgi:hypothetical protein
MTLADDAYLIAGQLLHENQKIKCRKSIFRFGTHMTVTNMELR